MIKVARAGVVIGEYPKADIPALVRAKVIMPTDDYWTTGMAGWSKVEALLTPPPITMKPDVDTQRRSPAPSVPAGKPKQSNRSLWVTLGATAFFVCLLILIFSVLLRPKIDPEQEAAFKSLQEKVASGDAKSLIALALCFQDGKGTSTDKEQAEGLFTRAAELGDPEALYRLAEFFYLNAGAKNSMSKAYAFSKLAYGHPQRVFESKLISEHLEEHATEAQKARGLELAEVVRDKIFVKSGINVQLGGSAARRDESTSRLSNGARYTVVGGSQSEGGETLHYYRITGEVKNVGSVSGTPALEIRLRSSSGSLISSKQTFPTMMAVRLAPGETCGLDQRIYSDLPGCTIEVKFIDFPEAPIGR